MKLDRLLWLKEINQDWKNDLVFTYEDEYGKRTSYNLIEQNSLIGVPRAFLHFADVQKAKEIPALPIRHSVKWPVFKLKLYDEQHKTVMRVLERIPKYQGGILQAKTGTGKTIMALYIAQKLGLRTIVLLHKSDLLKQWENRLKTCFDKVDIGIIQRDKFSIGEHCTLAMLQTLHSRESDLNMWKDFDLVISDEVHHLSAETWVSVIRKFETKYLLGLTATPKRVDGLEKVFFWHLGPILAECYQENEIGKFYQYRFSWKTERGFWVRDNLARAINVLIEIGARNDWIIRQIKRALAKNRKVLVLSDRVRHCEFLCKKIKDAVLYVSRVKRNPEVFNKQCVIATYGMVAEGIDVPEWDTLFLTTPRGNVEQAVGRIQRVCDGKKKPVLVDIVDTLDCPVDSLLTGMGWKRYHTLKRLGFKGE